jgi:hypothetical protein
MQGAQGVEQRQAGMHSAMRGIFVGLGPAKVDQQTIAEILGDMSIEVLDDLGTGGLMGAPHLPQVFRVELAGEAGGVH